MAYTKKVVEETKNRDIDNLLSLAKDQDAQIAELKKHVEKLTKELDSAREDVSRLQEKLAEMRDLYQYTRGEACGLRYAIEQFTKPE